ncbi:MAG: amino acid ABC transporter permease [Pseudodesulfovibrio sp.]|jgi:polar amino acid transport system permease protein|uniref:Amino acid ABC transporter membrane protein 1 (PAAT family) /amino acid ABC transporter membrane protein 2 (PAAT family) n=1 Tax=Pseudodesulfovibrio indicus TaxID=1716143 RepID=A0A126QQJ4_9BACT|nr:amino acid ABC transporter permease [Pseudodesulfovibrio indicus]AMK12069.1 amino acid ABC transporter permease [Pseudodesulfovibrio indicus]TDT88669.1 amino acid ABC transporter membrane protein 1 (PAAT family) /amino acid ABC transporter membrane protein 2 (PAAT family) [Pseudodesulfovibrio indicus]
MFKRYFEKVWVQNLTLLALVGLVVYYFAFIFEFKYDFDWAVFVTEGQYGHMGHLMVNGINTTLTITFYSAAIALFMGTVFGLARLSGFKPVYWFATSYVELFRNTPLLIQLFFWNFALPYAFPEEIRFKLFEMDFEFWCATIGCGIFTGAFMAEIIRAGIQSIPKGLLEASYSSGLTFSQTLRKIILPLAFREIIPPLGSEFLNNMKNTSLAMTIGVTELCWSMTEVYSLTYRTFEAFSVATLVYLGLSLTIAGILYIVNERLKIMPRDQVTPLRRLADILFWPFDALGRRMEVIFWYFRKSPEQKTISPLRRLLKASARKLVLAAKGLFVAALAYLLYMVALALVHFNWEIIWANLKTLLIWRFPNGDETEFFMGLGGLAGSVLMAVISITGSFFIGLFVGMGRTAQNRAIRIPCTLYIELIRGVPLILVILWFYQAILEFVFKVDVHAFWAATIAMTFFFGAYIAETVRGGIENIPPGQVEAAKASGLTYFQTMRKIILPQALKQMLPALVGMFIAAFKDTSLAYIIGVMELTRAAYAINNRIMIYPFEIYTTVAVLYFVCCYFMSLYAKRLERKLSPETVRIEM